MKLFFKELLEYTFYYNDKIIDTITNEFSFPEKSLQLINHIVNTQEIWNARITETPYKLAAWEIRPTETLKEINFVNYNTSLQIVNTTEFEKIINYKNSKNEAFEKTVRNILFHVVNHSTYHRAQIATDWKLNGIIPLVTDFIYFENDK